MAKTNTSFQALLPYSFIASKPTTYQRQAMSYELSATIGVHINVRS